jgi:hypothetical protein
MNLNDMKNKIKLIDPIYLNLLYYKTWDRKGQIKGVHNDFGKLSFFNSQPLAENYYCDQEEIVEILLEITSLLENFDSL